MCSSIFKECGWGEGAETSLWRHSQACKARDNLFYLPQDLYFFPKAERTQDPSQVEFVYIEEIGFLSSSQGKAGTAGPLLSNHTDSYFLHFSPTV